MAEIQTIHPKSFTDFVAEIESLQSKAEKSLWFRGSDKSRYKLLPGFYRRYAKGVSKKTDSKLEKQILTRFEQRSLPFLDRNLGDENKWDTLFLMQHYGIPTRLLDWTENPFIALYFAVMGAKPSGGRAGGRYDSNVCVWALDPIKWNKQALSNQSFEGRILAPGDEEIKAYNPGRDFSGEYPVCMYGTHNSRRIVAQRGVFTVFGVMQVAMEKLYRGRQFADDCLIKIEINKRYIGKIKKSLLGYGITESTIFPDLVGLAQEIKREFEY